ncbi:MAG: cysteine hydrolase family protein [Candidatus Geothermarchaeales archaeon]
MRAVLIVDMLTEFVYGRLGFEEARRIIPNIVKLLKWAREREIPIIYLRDSHSPTDHELKVWGTHAMKGSEDSKIIPELAPIKGETVIEKNTYSGFHGTELEDLLRKLKVDAVILAGVNTHICVVHTAADAFYRGFGVVVLSDCVASYSEEHHELFLKYMEEMYGARITSLRDLTSE